MKRLIAAAAVSAALLASMGTGTSASGAVRAGTALSGSTELDGHTLTWALSGAVAAPADLAESYDGAVAPGASLAFSGSAAFTMAEGFVTNLGQSASLSGAAAGVSFSQRVGGGTYTMPYSLTAKVPKAAADSTAEPGSVIGSVSASVSSRNCNDYGVCGGPTVTINLAVIAGAGAGTGTGPTTPKPNDTEPPTVNVPAYSKIVTLGNQKARFPETTTYPIKIPFTVADDSGKVKLHARLYSNGNPVSGADSPRFAATGKYVYKISSPPDGKGPYYWCIWAEDKAGNTSVNAPKSACTWLSLQVPVSKWSNGCGSDGVAEGWLGQIALWAQNFIGDARSYHGHQVQVRNACNVHDAAYAGVTLYDAIAGRFIDFRTWNRAQIDQLFFEDIQRRCAKDLTSAEGRQWLPTCQAGFTLAQAEEYFMQTSTQLGADGEPLGATLAWVLLQDKVGAQLYLDLVRKHGAVGFDTDATAKDTQPSPTGPTNPPGGERNNA